MADEGQTVSVHYEGRLDSGEVFDSSRQREPLEFVVGGGQIIAGFDQAVRDMGVGESKTVRLEPEQAYGERSDELLLEIPSSQAPRGLSAGDQVQLANGAPAVVLAVSEDMVKIDANHPLAGQALTLDIELVAVR